MECKSCAGLGTLTDQVSCCYCNDSGVLTDGMPCDECNGEMGEIEYACDECEGTGEVA